MAQDPSRFAWHSPSLRMGSHLDQRSHPIRVFHNLFGEGLGLGNRQPRAKLALGEGHSYRGWFQI